jgi:hypothetical protein
MPRASERAPDAFMAVAENAALTRVYGGGRAVRVY